MCHWAVVILFSAGVLTAKPPEWDRAHELYQRTDYQQSLRLLLPVANKDAETLLLVGQNYFMLGEYKKATDALEKALAMGNPSQELYLWLGRAYGRRAETSSPITAPGHASHARRMFEKAVELDISNRDAVGDLFDYYLDAPGFLGGGLSKASELTRRVWTVDPAESYYLQAQINEKQKEYEEAEKQLRHALDLAPRQVSRVLDLARYLAKRGRQKESDVLFDQAAKMAPENPRVLFYRAETYIQDRRNLDDARTLLERYLRAPLTPEDPPRERAQTLIEKTHR